MRGRIACLGLILGLSGLAAAAQGQQQITTPNESDIYCSGMVTTESVPRNTYIVSGEQSNIQTTFAQGDYVYINKGSRHGVKVGDEFLVMRPEKDYSVIPWFAWESLLVRGMGTTWVDIGRLRVIAVQRKFSVAEVATSCAFMQRGDYVRPFVERPVPQLRAEKFDRFAPPSGHRLAMVVMGKDFRRSAGAGDIVYVNQGSRRGVKVGDYFRVFRYQGGESETMYQTPGMATHVYGFGAAPGLFGHGDLPREILGEGVVLRVTPHSSTVLLTLSLREIFVGAYAELE